MKHIQILLAALFVASLLFFIPMHISYADCGANGNYNYQSSGQSCPPTLLQVTQVIASIVQIVLILSGVVFFFMLVLNGFNFITAVGDREKLEGARKGVVFTAIGFVIIFFSFIILNILAHVAGISNGFIVNPATGQFRFNIFSTYTPTPVYQPQTTTSK